MKFFLISDNNDTAVGMRMAGVDGVVVHTADEVKISLEKAISDDRNGIILITQRLKDMCSEDIDSIRLNRPLPLIVAIPDRHGNKNAQSEISKYVRDAIGISV